MNENKTATVGNLAALIFLGLTSLSSAYAPDGFGSASTLNHLLAVCTCVSGFKILYALG